jgi:hypothetical protein
MEASMALGIPEEQGHQKEALDAVAALLRHAESAARRSTAPSRRRKS